MQGTILTKIYQVVPKALMQLIARSSVGSHENPTDSDLADTRALLV